MGRLSFIFEAVASVAACDSTDVIPECVTPGVVADKATSMSNSHAERDVCADGVACESVPLQRDDEEVRATAACYK